jgi:CBS domain-containing protein
MELNEPIEKYVRKNIVVVNYNESIRNTAEIMKQKRIGSVLIEKDKKIVGIITERDILYKVVAEGKDVNNTKASEIMSSPLITINKNATVKEALEKFKQYNIRRLPVRDNGNIIGIITLRNVVGDILSLAKETELEEIKGFICPYCESIFATEKDLSKHIDRVHIGAGILETRRY